MAKVVVVGAGIIGASISKNLAARGAKVTVLEAAAGPAQGATGKSWAWLNSNYKTPQHYRDLNIRSMQLWKEQHSDLATFCGTLMLHDERPDPQDPAYPIQAVAADQLLALEPALNPELAKSATHARLFTLEGWCDPTEATQAFLDDAQLQGATVLFDQQVTTLSTNEAKATAVLAAAAQQPPQQQQEQEHTGQQQSSYPADAVVLAAGVGSPALALQLGLELPLLHKPAAIVMTKPVPTGLVRHMVIGDAVFILQRKDGRVLIGETHPEPASNTDTSTANAERILSCAAAVFPALRSATIEGSYVGYRPYPADGYPVLGWVNNSNVYVAVTHSGMTLAPLIGQLVAAEVMAAFESSSTAASSRGGASNSTSSVEEFLGPYRPNRVFNTLTGSADSRWAEAMRTTSS